MTFEADVDVGGTEVLVEVEMGVDGTDVLVDVGKAVAVETGMGVLVGLLAGRGVPQANEIRARTVASMANQILFILISLLE